MKKYSANLGNQVGFWDWKSIFHDFRTKRSYKIVFDGKARAGGKNTVPLKFEETNSEYIK